jgi:hypothetical protein
MTLKDARLTGLCFYYYYYYYWELFHVLPHERHFPCSFILHHLLLLLNLFMDGCKFDPFSHTITNNRPRAGVFYLSAVSSVLLDAPNPQPPFPSQLSTYGIRPIDQRSPPKLCIDIRSQCDIFDSYHSVRQHLELSRPDLPTYFRFHPTLNSNPALPTRHSNRNTIPTDRRQSTTTEQQERG